MANATHAAADTRPAALAGMGAERLLGFAIVCIAPAAFWIGLLAFVAWIFEIAVSSTLLLGGAAAICGFLAVIFSALTVNPRT